MDISSSWGSVLIAVLATLLAYLCYRIYSHLNYFSARGIPHCGFWYNFVNGMKAFSLNDPIESHFDQIYREPSLKDEKIIGFFQMFSHAYMVKDPEVIGKLLISDFTHFHDHFIDLDTKTNPLDANLFNLNGQNWKAVRTKMSPMFSSGKIKWMFDQIVTCGDNLVNNFEKIATGEDVEYKRIIALYGMDVIGSCAFGLNIDAMNNPNSKFVEMATKFLTPNWRQVIRFMIRIFLPKIFKLFKIRSIPADISDFFISVTKDTLNHRLTSNQKRNDFLQLLLQLKQQGYVEHDTEKDEDDIDSKDESNDNKYEFTDELLAAQVFIFFFAGYDSTATLTSYLLFFLSENPEIQEKVRKEIQEAVEKHGGATYEALKSMTYLDCCMSESLRFVSPGLILMRQCTKEYQYENFTIEKGSSIVIPIQSIHFDENIYENPKKFEPERFLDSEYSVTKSYGKYLPFGEGPRVCIARRFALIQSKVALVKILQNFQLLKTSKNIDPLKRDPKAFTIQPKGGLWIKVKKLKT